MKTDDFGNGICDGCGQAFCMIEVVGDQYLCGDCVRARIAALEAEISAALKEESDG